MDSNFTLLLDMSVGVVSPSVLAMGVVELEKVKDEECPGMPPGADADGLNPAISFFLGGDEETCTPVGGFDFDPPFFPPLIFFEFLSCENAVYHWPFSNFFFFLLTCLLLLLLVQRRVRTVVMVCSYFLSICIMIHQISTRSRVHMSLPNFVSSLSLSSSVYIS